MDVGSRCSIPTPFTVGRVNCYLFSENGLTLMDPGPATQEAYDELVTCLANHNYSIADVERILITHPHMDHFGIARRIVDQSGARVEAHGDVTDWLSDPIAYFEREQAFFRPFLVSMGMPREMVETVVELPEPYTDYQDPIDVDNELAEGDVVDVGVDLECVHTPGHAPGSLCFVAASADAMFTGDHVLPAITPNPLLTLVPGTDDERTRSLPAYVESLRKVSSVDATVGYGGHGEPIKNVQARVQETLDHHQRRKERIADFVDSTGPTTAYQVMHHLFPDLPVTEMFSGMSEVIGHLDLLEDEQRVEIGDREGVRQYELV